MIKPRHTLVRQFTIIILVILVAGQGILYTWLLLYQKSYLRERLEHEVTATAGHIAEMISTAGPEHPALREFLNVLLKDGVIRSITVASEDGRTLLHTGADKPRQAGADGLSLNPFAVFYIPDENTATAVFRRGAKDSGTVSIAYRGQSVNEIMRRFLVIPPVMQFLTFVIIVFAIVRFFEKKVSRPIRDINSALSGITAGDLATELPVLEDNEIGSVNRGLKFLLERLSSAITRFHSLSANVAAAMGQLTIALRNVSMAVTSQAKSIDGVIESVKSANDSQRNTTNHSESLARSSTDIVSSLLEMKAAAEEIALSTGKLFKSTEDSYTVIAEMSQSAKAIAASTGTVTQAVENTSASVEEMGASLRAVAEHTRESSELADRVRILLTEQGTKAVSRAADAMEKIGKEVNYSADIITRLDERSRDIEKILSVIKEVTEKTNLLSLNAAILAAQAGEYGKSFSVVADEIRSLSDRTSASAKDIAMIVKTIQEEISDAARAILTGVEKVGEGKDLIVKSGEAMGETLEAAQKSSRMATVIERATEEQAEGLRQIKLSMENIRAMIEKVATATEEERRGSAYILESISDIKEVAELVKKGTQEHAVGTDVISKNMDMAMDMVSQMNQSARDQLKVNDGIVGTVEQMKRAGTSIIKDMEEVMLSFGTLTDEIEILKKEMEMFKTGGSRQ